MYLLSLLACTGTKTPDTAPHTDTATDTAVDTGTVPSPQLGTITGTVRLPEGATDPGGLLLGLVGMEFSDAALLDTLTTAPISAGSDYSIDLSTPPPEALIVELEPSALPGLLGVIFLPVAFIDDGDGRYLPGEQIAGGSLSRLVVWLEGDVPSKYTYGWNIIDTGLSGTYETGNCLYETSNPLVWRSNYNRDYPVIYGLDEQVDVDLFGLEADVTLAGTATGLLKDERLTLLSYQTLFSGSKDETWDPLQDLSLTDGAFSADFADPPDRAYDVSPDPSWDYALLFGVTYQDGDGSGGYTPGEGSSDASLCVNNSLAALRYTWPVSTYRGWRLMECYSVHAGWRVVTRETDGTWAKARTDAEAAAVVIDSSVCSF
ncbi:MAG: hypothetical protein ACI8S6_001154 [Myxococcota bacterium]|jgi:hypothetical protein